MGERERRRVKEWGRERGEREREREGDRDRDRPLVKCLKISIITIHSCYTL